MLKKKLTDLLCVGVLAIGMGGACTNSPDLVDPANSVAEEVTEEVTEEQSKYPLIIDSESTLNSELKDLSYTEKVQTLDTEVKRILEEFNSRLTELNAYELTSTADFDEKVKLAEEAYADLINNDLFSESSASKVAAKTTLESLEVVKDTAESPGNFTSEFEQLLVSKYEGLTSEFENLGAEIETFKTTHTEKGNELASMKEKYQEHSEDIADREAKRKQVVGAYDSMLTGNQEVEASVVVLNDGIVVNEESKPKENLTGLLGRLNKIPANQKKILEDRKEPLSMVKHIRTTFAGYLNLNKDSFTPTNIQEAFTSYFSFSQNLRDFLVEECRTLTENYNSASKRLKQLASRYKKHVIDTFAGTKADLKTALDNYDSLLSEVSNELDSLNEKLSSDVASLEETKKTYLESGAEFVKNTREKYEDITNTSTDLASAVTDYRPAFGNMIQDIKEGPLEISRREGHTLESGIYCELAERFDQKTREVLEKAYEMKFNDLIKSDLGKLVERNMEHNDPDAEMFYLKSNAVMDKEDKAEESFLNLEKIYFSSGKPLKLPSSQTPREDLFEMYKTVIIGEINAQRIENDFGVPLEDLFNKLVISDLYFGFGSKWEETRTGNEWTYQPKPNRHQQD